jgi:hypothetical protein
VRIARHTAAIAYAEWGERMTLSRQFLHRYTRIQKGVQEQAELELAQAMLAGAESAGFCGDAGIRPGGS